MNVSNRSDPNIRIKTVVYQAMGKNFTGKAKWMKFAISLFGNIHQFNTTILKTYINEENIRSAARADLGQGMECHIFSRF